MRKSTLLAAVCLALPALAWAADPCLTGASLLTDQRALASLRDGTETACPCASFTGGPGLNRGAYRSCARGVLDAALAAVELRAECRRNAQSIIKGAVCGSTGRVACGRFKPAARTPVGCKVRPAARCVDRPNIDSSACTGETHCADVVDWSAGTCVDARDNGPFAAGVRIVTFSKQSVVNPLAQRDLETLIWYPAPAGSGPITPAYSAVLDAPLDLPGGPYPILMFSHGSCGYAAQSTFLTALLASHGFIVVAPPHPGNTIADFPACGTPAAQLASAQERPQDIIFVLDQMLAENADAGSPFFGAIDETRIGMSGHSFGGFTTYLVTALDSRFDVAIPMAPAVPGSPILPVPSLTMLGKIDSVVDNDDVRQAFTDATAPKYLVEIDNAGHYAFSNGCFPGPDCSPPVTLTQAEANAVVKRWVLPFLKLHLAGDASFAAFFAAPVPPGVSVTTAP